MSRRAVTTAALILAVIAGGAALAGGVYVRHHLTEPPLVTVTATVTEMVEDGRRPEFSLPDSDGQVRSISEWDGKLLLVNFWATWCPPCLHEIPVFIELQARYADRGVQFLGIAIDEAENVNAFAEQAGLNYPTLIGQLDAIEITKAFGNRTGGLPFTVVIAPDGEIIARHTGAMSRSQAESVIEKSL